ncbi:O-antigen acetylase [Bordetella sp. J329]|nr:O-antigen acetylase [Bordetella sp. J329]
MKFRNDINGLRCVAVLLVLFFHFLIPGFGAGFLGVDIFFVISGYLMTGILYEKFSVPGVFSFLGFYAARVKRIIPALFF